jgi:hypothetical protein
MDKDGSFLEYSPVTVGFSDDRYRDATLSNMVSFRNKRPIFFAHY